MENFNRDKWSPCGFKVSTVFGDVIADCGSSDDPRDIEEIANAHLIAAAPEMYAALKLISDISILDADKGLSSLVDELLAKARGESCGK